MSTATSTGGEKKRIAVLEDNPAQAEAVIRWLERAGYDVVHAADGDAFIELIGKEQVDMLLLDWDVPGKTGIEVLAHARDKLGFLIPIVMITQHDDERDIVHGLERGADDYLVKPASERMLIARVVAQLRKYYPQTQAAQSVEHEGYVLTAGGAMPGGDVKPGHVMLPGTDHPIELPEREFKIAYYLFQHAGRVVARDTLFTYVWGKIESDQSGTLATYITRLRNALKLRAHGLKITSVYRHGYRLERLADAVSEDD